MLKKSRLMQLSIMLLILLALVLWRTLAPLPRALIDAEIDARAAPADLMRCDYVTPCEFMTKQGSFWLNVTNPPIKAEQWIYFNLQSDLKNWQLVDATIIGKSMFMGRIPVSFAPTAKGFSGKAMLAACTHAEMLWQLQIRVEANEIKEELFFDFIVNK